MKRSPRWVLLALVGGVALSLWASGCGGVQSQWSANKKAHVLVSFPPLYCFVTNVVADDPDVEVQTLISGDVEPHEFDPSVQDAQRLREANVFFVNGLGLEPWADRARGASGNPSLKITALGEEVPEKDRITSGAAVDPHVWLGIPEAILMVRGIEKELTAKYPARAATYKANTDAYVAALTKIHEDGKKALSEVRQEDRNVIAFHDSLQYFARSFGLNVAGVVEMEPKEPPTPQKLNEIVSVCKEKNVRVIVSEPLYDLNGVTQLLRKRLTEAGVPNVQIVEIDPLESAKMKDLLEQRDYYEQTMKKNVANLVEKMPKVATKP